MLQFKRNLLGSLAIFVILFSSCYGVEKTKGVAYLNSCKSDSLEIEIPYIIKGRGSLHNFTFEKFKDSSASWIYISGLQKKVTADSLVLIYAKGYLPQSNLRGEINIEDSTLIVNFKIPRYNNRGIVKRWVDYKFNGTYGLKRR